MQLWLELRCINSKLDSALSKLLSIIINLLLKLCSFICRSGVDTEKNEYPKNFPILPNISPIFHNVFPIFTNKIFEGSQVRTLR